MESLEDITISPSVPSIELFAFSKCPKLLKISFDPTSTQILKFSTCKFKHLVILKSINFTYIGDYFRNYINEQFTNINHITIPSSVTSIGKYAFDNCSSLTSIEIPSSLTSIGEYAFYNCSSLTSIEIPSSVTSIGKYAFNNCSSLTSIEIQSSVTSIGEYDISGCSNLKEITIDLSNIQIDSQNKIFNNCKSLNHLIIYTKCLFINRNAAKIIRQASSITLVTILSSVISIGESAFYNCSSLTSIEIPSSVTSIGRGAFYRCSSLTSIEIPSSVTSIGDDVFCDCSSLRNLTIPRRFYNLYISGNNYVSKNYI